MERINDTNLNIWATANHWSPMARTMLLLGLDPTNKAHWEEELTLAISFGEPLSNIEIKHMLTDDFITKYQQLKHEQDIPCLYWKDKIVEIPGIEDRKFFIDSPFVIMRIAYQKNLITPLNEKLFRLVNDCFIKTTGKNIINSNELAESENKHPLTHKAIEPIKLDKKSTKKRETIANHQVMKGYAEHHAKEKIFHEWFESMHIYESKYIRESLTDNSYNLVRYVYLRNNGLNTKGKPKYLVVYQAVRSGNLASEKTMSLGTFHNYYKKALKKREVSGTNKDR